MKCLKISHRVILSSLFALFALPFLFSSGRASASSYSLTVSESSLSGLTNYTDSDVGFSFKYVSFHFYGGGVSGRVSAPCYYWDSNLTASVCPMLWFDHGDNFTLLTVQGSKVGISPGYGWNTVDISFYDSDPFVSEPCPDCPEVPEETEVLLDIKRSILFIPAMLFVIYLFYILYSFYIGGSR